MQIQWYPGHMTKARRAMQEDLKLVDLVMELTDARAPLAGRNPDIDKLAAGKARMIFLNKADLADDQATLAWMDYFRKKGITPIRLDARKTNFKKAVVDGVKIACQEKIERDRRKGILNRPIRAMVVGIPNVGKSTFINSLAGKTAAKTGNKPGVTRGNQWIKIDKQLELLDKNEYRFVWITEFPLLEWSEEQNRFVAMHHPFTMPMEEDIQYIESDPGRVRAKAYDIVLNGNEIGGGSVRIFQDDIQEMMFKALGFTKEQAYSQFGFLLDAFKYGVPPHAGLAYGLDRLVMLMAKQDSIRDVIAFPKIKDASCLMTEAPTPASEKQLEELSLTVEAQEETVEE